MAVFIKKWRSSKALSLNAAAKISGIPQSTISSYEMNRVSPTMENQKRLAVTLQVQLTDIIDMAEYDKNTRIKNKQKDQ